MTSPSRAGLPTGPPWRAVWGRRLERLAWSVGLLLLFVFGLSRLIGTSLEQRDLRRFAEAEAAQPASRASGPQLLAVAPHPVDQSQWARERIHAYARALKEEGPPPLAVLRIPRIGLEVPVLDGTDEWTLDRAVGWVEGTARPGESGNVAIAGHRDGFFRGLKELRPGDEVVLATLAGRRSYRIERIRIVRPEDVQMLEPTPVPALTLITCYPFFFVGSAPERYIVRARATAAENH